MKKIMVLDKEYPSPNHLYGDVFVHTRIKEYKKHADIKVISFFRDYPDYEYEGVTVTHLLTVEALLKEYEAYAPDAVFIHFYDHRLYGFIQSVKVPVIIWVHGYEALGWYRRLYNHTLKSFLFHAWSNITSNIRQMKGFRELINYSNKTGKVKFVFVSKWMRNICETDSFFARIKHFYIIPNPINLQQFRYEKKNDDLRKKILLIRSFSSRKYATDIAVDAITALQDKPYFKELHFALYGDGDKFETITQPLKGLPNVALHRKFLPNSDIAEIHKQYGIFLCPTRQDAQGVSMCEAMASGLIPITTDCTAIPEFVTHMKSGWLTRSSKGLTQAIDALYKSPELFSQLSYGAAASIKDQCDIEKIIQKELNTIG
ncbi:MAG: glycosyltransferase family 4 protein [Bacteroidota bacterium]